MIRKAFRMSVHPGRAQEYEHLASLLAPLRMPVYMLPGNHDDRDTDNRAGIDHRAFDFLF